MNRDGIPLPLALSGVVDERIIRVDSALIYLVAGALTELTDSWQFEQTGSLTVEATRDHLSDMLYEFLWGEKVTPIGMVMARASANVPSGWLLCDGSAVSRSTYSRLFAEIGTVWGAGNGTTTFNLPDMRDRSIMGTGGSTVANVGDAAGQSAVSLTISQMPAHDHDYAQVAHTHNITDPGHVHSERAGNGANAFVTVGGGTAVAVNTLNTGGTTPITTNTAATGITVSNASAGITFHSQGGNAPHLNVHPVRGMPFFIYAGV
jgi:microcystin-dependent protein